MTARNRTGRSERALRASVAAACLALAPQLGHAQSDLDALRACATEHDDVRRLACYDQAVGVRKRSGPPAEAAPASAAREPNATAPVAGPSPEEQFGYRGAIARKELDEKAAQDPVPDQVEAAVAEVARRPRGELVLTLDNGQVWAQKTADSSRVKVGDRVTIRKASFNSFLLVLPNNRSTRVVRER
jgi:hypothetical protein